MAKKKILFIAHRTPYPPNKGDKIRSFNELAFFHQFYDIDLVTFYDDPNDRKFREDLMQYCSSVYMFYLNKKISLIKGLFLLLIGKSISVGCYENNSVKIVIDDLLKNNNYYFAFCYSSQVAQYLLNVPCKTIIDFVDVDSDKWRQYAQKAFFLLRPIYNLEYKRLSVYERIVSNRFTRSVFSTKQEMDLFTENKPSDKITVLSNGVDYAYFSPQKIRRERTLIFTGAMDYFPNVDAVLWFCNTIFPDIIKEFPDVTFYIVGSNPTYKVRKLSSKNIIVTGFVKDIRPYFARSALAVYPLRIARGIQNKILEAMSMGITPLIPENLRNSLDEPWPEETLIYKNEKDCVKFIVETLKQIKSDTPPSENLRNYILEHRDWQKRLTTFHNDFVNILEDLSVDGQGSEQISEKV